LVGSVLRTLVRVAAGRKLQHECSGAIDPVWRRKPE
jgi:hypothetical protein